MLSPLGTTNWPGKGVAGRAEGPGWLPRPSTLSSRGLWGLGRRKREERRGRAEDQWPAFQAPRARKLGVGLVCLLGLRGGRGSWVGAGA